VHVTRGRDQPVKIDIVLNATAAPGELARLGVLAEQYGVQTVWTASYLASRDPFSNLVPLALATRTIGLGPIAVNPYDTHPVRIATSLLTLNEHAAGRARIVVGGGGEALQALGIRPARRVRAVGECVQILKEARSDAPWSFTGEIYQVTNYFPAWAKAPRPPIYVAANKPQMLRMAARVSDGVMLSDLTPAICRERIGWVGEHLREFGRPGAPFCFSNFLAWHVYDDGARARREARMWLGYRGLFRRWVLNTFMTNADYDVIEAHKAEIYGMVPKRAWSVPGVPDALLDACVDNLTLTGTPADMPRIIAQLRRMQEAGCTDVVLELHEEPEPAIHRIGRQVLPEFR
jgi:alkanesulfonate monooxygenase SsuD/methylene tetrahydromethanopterin reductase-like flavin-dependent oxidoreductase (luciferase family)